MRKMYASKEAWWFSLLVAIGILLPMRTEAQCNSHTIDLSSYAPDTSWRTGVLPRDNQCCAAVHPSECIRFIVTLNPNTIGVRFYYLGAPAHGAETWQLNCGTQYAIRDSIACLSGLGPHEIVFCKPGGNDNEYVIEAVAKPTVPAADSVRVGCSRQLHVYGIQKPTITWTSITGGVRGTYDHYLDSVHTNAPIFTPDASAPTFIDYEICGFPIATNCGYNTAFCDTMRVYIFPELVVSAIPNPASFCNIGMGSGVTLTGSATGGLPPYSFRWVNSSGTQVSGTNTYFATSQGNYTLEVRDRLTRDICGPERLTVPVQVGSLPTANAGVDQTLCATSPSATLSATVTNATGGYWTGGAGTFFPDDSLVITSYTPTAGEISTGFVDLTFHTMGMGGGCTSASDVVRLNFISPVVVNLNSSGTTCFGDTAVITTSVSGGIAPYSFQWNTNSTNDTLWAGVGSYTVIVTESSSAHCTGTATIAVTAPTPIELSMTATPISAAGFCDGTASVIASGGVGPYTYLWSNGSTSNAPTGLCYGVHAVTVTDANGCTATASTVVNDPLCSGFSVDVSNMTLNCYGDLSGVVTASTTNGNPGFSFVWNTKPAQFTQSITGLAAGTYTVTVTDNIGCVQVGTGLVSEPSILTNQYTSQQVSTIGGNDGEATANPNGGTAPYSYQWSTGAISQTITGLFAGVYHTTITDKNGCILIDSIRINQPPCNTLSLGVVKQNITCAGFNNGSASIYTLGGTPPYTFVWQNGNTTTSATGLAGGVYTVTVTDDKECTQFLNFTIEEPSPLSVALDPNAVTCHGRKDGTVDADVAGGTFPYTFVWSNGSSTEDLAYLSGGNFSVTVRDANNCAQQAFASVFEPVELKATLTPTHVTCYGDNSGSIDLYVNGGVAPYSYLWSSGQTQQDLSNLIVGIYGVTVTDVNGCKAIKDMLIDEPDSLSVDSIFTACPAPGASQTDITILASGGFAPYSYSTDGGATFGAVGDSILTVSTGDIYSIVVSDTAGCLSNTVIDWEVYPTLVIDSVIFNDCYTSPTATVPVTVQVSGGQGALYQISTDNGASYAAIGVYNFSLAVGNNYHIIAKDSVGCTSDTFFLSLPDPFDVTATVTSNHNGADVSCNGVADGSASASATGGVSPYSFLWSNGQTTAAATGLTAGTYTVTMTDASGCAQIDTVTLTAPSGLSVSISSQTTVTCFGAATGSATAAGSGGTGSYTFAWSNGQSTANATGLTAGTYTVTLTDANGCLATTNVTINQPASAVGVSAAVTSNYNGSQISCIGAADGQATATGTGGTGTINYNWNNGQTTTIATGLIAGTYTVTATDANNCTATASVTLSNPTAVTATIASQVSVTCFGASTGSATAAGAGGTGAYTFAWSNGQSTANATGLATGTYTVTVLDANNCSATTSVTINQPASAIGVSAAVTSNYNGSQISCIGAADGQATATGTGGTGSISYNWNNGQTTAIATGLIAGTYMVTATDANNCTATANVTLSNPTAVTATIASQVSVTCFGASTGSATAAGSGGTGAYTFLWSNGQTAANATGLATGTYTVTVLDANNCSATTSVTINQPASAIGVSAAVTSNYNGSQISCIGAADGQATATGTGGTGSISYNWNNGQTTAIATGLIAGTYMVTATDANNCTATANVTLSNPTAVTASIANQTTVTCAGFSNADATVAGTGGTGAYTFIWSDGQTTATATGLNAGNYTVTIADANGCSATTSVSFSDPATLVVNITTSSYNGIPISCFGSTDGFIEVAASGGTGALSFFWNDGQTTATATGLGAGSHTVTVTDANGCFEVAGATFGSPNPVDLTVAVDADVLCFNGNNGIATATATGGIGTFSFAWSDGQTTASATGLSAGVYNVTATDLNGCSITDVVILTEPTALQIGLTSSNYNGSPVSCFGSTDGSLTVTPTGGTPGYTFLWNNNQTTATATGLGAGNYTVTVTDANGCTVSDFASFSDPAQLSASSIASDVACLQTVGDIDLTAMGGTQPYSFLWSNGATTEDVDNLGFGTYQVTITDANGCSLVWQDTVHQLTYAIEIDGIITDSECYAANTGSINTTISGALLPVSYQWSNDATEEDLQDLSAGIYTVTVSDANGCSATASFEVMPSPDTLGLTLVAFEYPTGFNTSMKDVADGSIDATVSGGSQPFGYAWSNGATTEDISAIGAGSYVLTVTDVNGCTVSAEITLTEPDPTLPEMPEGISPDGNGKNDFFVVKNIEYYPDNQLIIYNRWGEELIRFESYHNEWDGYNRHGSELPEGTYYAILIVRIPGMDEDYILNGHVDIRR